MDKYCTKILLFGLYSCVFLQALFIFQVIDFNYRWVLFGYGCVLSFVPPFSLLAMNKNSKSRYLEHAAKIMRHDMHSGINTYLPRGIRSLRRKLGNEQIKELGIEKPLRLLEDGLLHTQKVYGSVRAFTNLVKENPILEKEEYNLYTILDNYIRLAPYSKQVFIGELGKATVNKYLFCTAIDNMIRNGLKYNDSPKKWVEIRRLSENYIVVSDNGRGMTQTEFDHFCKPYVRKENQKESGTGLGLDIAKAILDEHKFEISVLKKDVGTDIRIKIK